MKAFTMFAPVFCPKCGENMEVGDLQDTDHKVVLHCECDGKRYSFDRPTVTLAEVTE